MWVLGTKPVSSARTSVLNSGIISLAYKVFKDLLILCLWLFRLHLCMCALCMRGALGGRRGVIILKLVLASDCELPCEHWDVGTELRSSVRSLSHPSCPKNVILDSPKVERSQKPLGDYNKIWSTVTSLIKMAVLAAA